MYSNDFPLRLYAAHVNAPEHVLKKWYELMPESRRQKADRFKNEPDRHRCITAYALLAFGIRDIAKDTGIELSDSIKDPLPVEAGEDGKPFIASLPFMFNISHSGDRVIVAFSPREVGCDVEKKSRSALRIAKQFFAKEEYEHLLSIEDEAAIQNEFTGLWTLKESVVKCCGEGIRHPLNDFCLVDDKGNRKRKIRLKDRDSVYHVREYESENGYHYGVCSLSEDMEDEMRFVSWEMISK